MVAPQGPEFTAAVLGGPARYTGPQVVQRAGIDRPLADALWQALGFPHLADDVAAFTDGDVAALAYGQRLLAERVLDEPGLLRMSRLLGRSFAGLAEAVLANAERAEAAGALADPIRLLDDLEVLQRYVWRRHVLAGIERRAARPEAGSAPIAVGFTDLVGFTAASRELSARELDDWLDRFERRCQEVIVEGDGRLVKTLGDEVMWVADVPAQAARIALALAGPEVRTGVAYGPALARAGDYFGPTVNVAARLTALARPGTVLVDTGMDAALATASTFRLRHLRPVSVRGYEHLRATVLRPA